MRKILFGISALLLLLWNCSNESDPLSKQPADELKAVTRTLSQMTSSGLGVDNQILFLQADTVSRAGELVITANVPELTLAWNVSEQSNLDTTLTRIDVANGHAILNIKWAKKLTGKNFAPEATAFINGVRISDGTTSLYVHLVLTTDPVIDDFEYLLDYPVSVTPDASFLQITPSEVQMTAAEGGTAQVMLEGTAPVQIQTERIGSFTQINQALLPESIEDNGKGEIPFRWKTSPPDANFKVIYYAYSYDTNLQAEAVVSYTVQNEAFLSIHPDSIRFLDAGGTLAARIETNQDKWVLQNIDQIPDWLTYSATEGKIGTSTLNLTASSNPSTQSRSCLLSLLAGTTTKEINVEQSGFKPELNISYSSFPDIKAEGEALDINVVSNVDWQLSKDIPEWLHPDKLSGSKNGVIVFSVDPIQSFESRTATISIISQTGTPSITREITFTQNGREFKVSPPMFTNISVTGGSVNAVVTSNVNWQVSNERPSWIHPNIQSGSENGTIIFKVDANNTFENRTASVKILTTIGGTEVSKEVSFTQNSRIFTIVPTSFPNVKPIGENISVNINSNVDWVVSGDLPNWLHPSEQSGSGDGSIVFTIDPNMSSELRTASVEIFTTLDGAKISKNITFTQQNMRLDVSPMSYTNISEQGGSFDVNISSNANWQITGNVANWLHPSVQSGIGNSTIKFAVDANTTFAPRSATVLIATSVGTEVITREVVFTQKPADPFLTISNSTFTNVSRTGAELSTTLSSNLSWTVVNENSWIQVTPDSGSGNSTLHIVVSKNRSLARKGTITLRSTNGEQEVTATIIVEQKGWFFC